MCLDVGASILQDLYPGTRKPFQELGMFPSQKPGSKFSSVVVFSGPTKVPARGLGTGTYNAVPL